MYASYLHVVSVSYRFKHLHFLPKLWKSYMDRTSQGCAQIRRTRGYVAKMVVVGEASDLLDSSCSTGKATENFTDIGTLLHGDDTKLVLFVNPYEESLSVVVEDSTTMRPVAIKADSLEEAITFFEQEVISNQLLLIFSTHTVKWVELALEVTIELVAGLDDFTHNRIALPIGDARAERVVSQVTTNTDPRGLDKSGAFLREWWAIEFGVVHVGDVTISRAMAVILLDDVVEEIFEGGVRLLRASVDTDTRVDVLAAREDALLERDTGSVLLVVILVPHLLREVFAEE